MCGINGFTFGDREKIDAMNARLKHRGPDRQAAVVFPACSLGTCRLAIIDLSPLGNQPMANPENERFWITYNGEIYNFRELREELEMSGHRFRSKSDTEVILHGFEQEGASFFKKLNGIFAFAIWDTVQKALVFARDPIGVKPLYYFWDGKRLIFSSELKALLAHDIPRQINERALRIYFQLSYVPAPLTIFENVYKLEPGTLGRFSGGRLALERYWGMPRPDAMPATFSEATRLLRGLMEDAVRRQLVADVPVGVFLSGGIDSTLIAALSRRFHSGPLQTFTIGFAGHPPEEDRKFNQDFALARETAKALETQHHEVIVGGAEAREVLEDCLAQMDEPNANPTQLPTRLLARFARARVTVALGGDGGDELFGGYPRYRFNQLLNLYQRLPRLLRRLLVPGIERFSGRTELLQKLETPPGLPRYLLFMSQKPEELRRVLLDTALPSNDARDWLARLVPPLPWRDEAQELMRLDLATWLAEESLMRTDKMTMAESLEERVPWLDRRVVELALSLPSRWKLRRGEGKWIVRRAFRDLVPSHVLGAPKRGWFAPAAKWLRGELRPLVEEILSPRYAPGSERYLNFAGVRQVLEEHLEKRRYHFPLLWSLVTFQVWHRSYMRR